jgi:hypothetical protein
MYFLLHLRINAKDMYIDNKHLSAYNKNHFASLINQIATYSFVNIRVLACWPANYWVSPEGLF